MNKRLSLTKQLKRSANFPPDNLIGFSHIQIIIAHLLSNVQSIGNMQSPISQRCAAMSDVNKVRKQCLFVSIRLDLRPCLVVHSIRMKLCLQILNNDIILEDRVIFRKPNTSEFIFSLNGEAFHIEEKSSFLDRLFGKENYYVYKRSTIKQIVGNLKMYGMRRIDINLARYSKPFFAQIKLLQHFFKAKQTFIVGCTEYNYQKPELRIENSDEVSEIDILVGCFMLFQLNRMESGNAPFDCDM